MTKFNLNICHLTNQRRSKSKLEVKASRTSSYVGQITPECHLQASELWTAVGDRSGWRMLWSTAD